MNRNWRNRPTTIDSVPKDISWVIAIDESGSPDLSSINRAIIDGRDLHEGEKQFTVTACAIRTENILDIQNIVMEIKHKYWTDALFNYGANQKRICFHSKEIRGRKGPFSPSVINYNAFVGDISQMMSTIPVTLFSANINKYKHVQQYCYPDDPYKLCMNFLLERIMFNMKPTETCCIVLESRGKKADRELLDTLKDLLDRGNNMNNAQKFSKIKGIYFNPKWSKSCHEQKSYWSLELADLCAFPIHKYLAYQTQDESFNVLLPKICGFPNINGRGLKVFP